MKIIKVVTNEMIDFMTMGVKMLSTAMKLVRPMRGNNIRNTEEAYTAAVSIMAKGSIVT